MKVEFSQYEFVRMKLFGIPTAAGDYRLSCALNYIKCYGIYDVDLIINQFAKYKVTQHFLIAREGVIYQMVTEKDIAYHAGVSRLHDGSTGINSRSIGIEIITSFDEAPSALQMDASVKLVKYLKEKYQVKYVLRHSDIAPGRKTDPWNMNWKEFLEQIEN